MAAVAPRRKILWAAPTIAVALGLVPLAPPIVGIFARTVSLNNLFMAILSLVTVVAVAGLVLAVRAPAHTSSSLLPIVVTVAVVEIVFLALVWITIATTGAYGDGFPHERGRTGLFHESLSLDQ